MYLITSPAVRAENLRFKEEGVKELIAKVFLPWYNSYRFFFSQLLLLKKEHGLDFVYDASMDLSKDSNVMDGWILASTQSLIKFVRQEMSEYRLYTVTPRLLGLIEDLTNWYIRFNRKRLKGENGTADAIRALNVLFEVLFVLVRMMAAFTPFICETMYQNLRKCLPPSTEDTRSVHFLLFPEIKEEYFNADIERSVNRMRTVIELGRVLREQKNLALKTPLSEFIVITPDLQYHKDIQSLENYILEEMNIRTLTVTAEEEKYGVKYKLVPDAKNLGLTFKKDASKIRSLLPNVSQNDIKKFISTQTIVLDGFQLSHDHIQVVRTFENGDSSYLANFNNDVLVILDTAMDQSLEREGMAREIVNRIQRLRKKGGLIPTDDILYYIEIKQDLKDELKNVLEELKDVLFKYLKQDIMPVSLRKSDDDLVICEEQEVIFILFVILILLFE